MSSTLDDENPGVELTTLARRLFAGAGFRGSSFVIVRLIQVARLVIFARIFLPAEMGLANLAVGCIGVLSVLANPGFPQSLFRRKDNSPLFTNTIFSLSLIFGILVFLITLIFAPLLSRIFSTDLDQLIRLLAVLTLTIPLRFPAFLWEKELDYWRPSVGLVIVELLSLVITIGLELLYHLGALSLLLGNVTGFLFSALFLWMTTAYRPKLEISSGEVRPVINFGIPLMISNINGEVMARGDNLLVGAYHGTEQLAFYNFAWQLPTLISSLTQTVDSMLLPVYVRLDHDAVAIRRLFNLTNKLWAITGSFLGCALFIYADVIVFIIYGAAWEPIVPILRVMSISFVIRYCTGYAYDNLVLARGRTRYIMNWGIVNTILVFSVGQLMIKHMGPVGGAWFWVVQAVVLIPMVRLPVIHQELGTLEFVFHIWQPVVAGLVAGLFCSLIGRILPFHKLVEVIPTALVYVIVYFSLLILLDRQLRKDTVKLSKLLLFREKGA
jgi:O-antigen/teichoic acid export membrane protein